MTETTASFTHASQSETTSSEGNRCNWKKHSHYKILFRTNKFEKVRFQLKIINNVNKALAEVVAYCTHHFVDWFSSLLQFLCIFVYLEGSSSSEWFSLQFGIFVYNSVRFISFFPHYIFPTTWGICIWTWLFELVPVAFIFPFLRQERVLCGGDLTSLDLRQVDFRSGIH